MSIEDRVRAATRARTDLIREIRPLQLTENAPKRVRRTWFALPWAGWLIPLTAAVAVVAVATVLVAVKGLPAAGNKASTAPASSRSAGPDSSAAAADPEALPAYFAAISGFASTFPMKPGTSGPAKDPLPDSLIVGETLTGRRLATVAPPAGSTFVGVTGAADDRTFVLDSIRLVPGILFPTQPRTWQVLTIDPGAAEVTRLTSLSLPLPNAADVIGIALSPDGTKLAVFYEMPSANASGFPYSGPFTMAVYSVPGGALLRSWTGTDPNHGGYAYGSDLPDGSSLLSWTSDGRLLAFDYRSSKAPTSSLYLREVSLSSPGEDLFADSKVIATIGVSATTGMGKIWCESLGITGDGQTAVCAADMPRHPDVGATLDALTQPADSGRCDPPTNPDNPGLAEISLAGDRLTRVLYEDQPKCMGGGWASVLWSSPSGDTVLGAAGYPDPSMKKDVQAVILYRQGKVTTLTWPGAASLLSGNLVAF